MTTRSALPGSARGAPPADTRPAQDMTVATSGLDRATLAVAGEVDASNADRLRRAILDAASEHDGELAVDLAGITFMDSSGVRALSDASRALDPSAFGLVLCNVPRQTQRILELTQSGRALKVRR